MRPVAVASLGLMLAGLVFAAASPGQALSPSPPFQAIPTLEGEPWVGEPAKLTVEFQLWGTPALEVRLHASPGVEVLDDPTVSLPSSSSGSQVFTFAWRFVVSHPGFWSLALSATEKNGSAPYPMGGSCCGGGHSTEDGGTWAAIPGWSAELPDAEGTGAVRTEVVGDRVRLNYTASGAAWLDEAGARLKPQVGPGSIAATYRQRAWSLDQTAWEVELDVPDGGEALAYAWSEYYIAFPEPVDLPASGHSWSAPIFAWELHCQNMRIVRDGDRARIEETLACGEAAGGLGRNVANGKGVPALPTGFLVLALLTSGTHARRRPQIKFRTNFIWRLPWLT